MLADSKNVDHNFVKQIEDARPTTKEFMNSLIEIDIEREENLWGAGDRTMIFWTLDKNTPVYTHEDKKSDKEEKEEDQMAIWKQVLLMKKVGPKTSKHDGRQPYVSLWWASGQKPLSHLSRKGKLCEEYASSEGL